MASNVVILGPNGRPISSSHQNKKVEAPKTGQAFGAWAGRDSDYIELPGGGVVQFDLDKLTVQDFRAMRDHYQVNISLAALTFMQHQSDWSIECEDKKIGSFAEDQLRSNWTMLNRTMAQSNWAGYSPGVLDWEYEGRRVVLDKIRDLRPEDCDVKWDEVEGWAPPGRSRPKFKVYGGIKQFGSPYPIPVENSFWYPMLMENGNYYGRKLLRAAFQSYFFSILMHLFANRYYERFGEPVPVGRAPFEDDLTVDGQSMSGNKYMLKVLQDLRNRSVIVLPNEKTQFANEPNPSFDYDIEYLESQMRGADFERYMTRLDEEISLAIFTPILMTRTADVGSYNLGQGHMQTYLWMLNAMNDDRKLYVDKYILSKMTDYNFGVNAPRPRMKFRKLGQLSAEMIKEILTALTQQNRVKYDYEELGQIAGMTLSEIKETVADAAPAADDAPDADPTTDAAAADASPITVRARTAHNVAAGIVARVRGQVQTAFANNTFGAGLRINMGFKKSMSKAFAHSGLENHAAVVDSLYSEMDNWIESTVSFGTDEFSTSEEFVSMFSAQLADKIDNALRG